MGTMTMVQKLRRINLKRLVAELFEGNASEAGRKLATSHTYMWQIISGHRGIGERSAREIEAKLKLQPYDLDRKHGGTATPAAYLIKVPVRSLEAVGLRAKASEHLVCPIAKCSSDVFAVIADDDTEAMMVEFREGDAVFIDPCIKAQGKGLHLVRDGTRVRLLLARADGEGGFHFYTTLKPQRIEGRLSVLGRVIAATRHFA